jgi:hypothetical protein
VDQTRARRELIATLVGESLREVAVLVLVFAPLDAVTQGIALTPRLWMVIIVVVMVLFASGIYLETRRQ